MKVLVTGVTGMLGTSIARRFLEEGHELHGLSRGHIVRDFFPGEKYYQVDISDPEKVKQIFQSLKPDAVIHSAAVSDVDYCEKMPNEAYRINGEGTRILAASAEECGAIFCYISSDYVFDGGKAAPYREEDLCNPINVYGKSKLLGEEHTRTLSKWYFIIRTSWLFGEGRDSFVHHVLGWARAKKEIRLVEDKQGSPTYTVDLAGAIHRLFKEKAPWGIYHVANQGGCSWLEYGRKVLEYGGVNGISLAPIRLGELKLLAERPLRTVLSSDKFCGVTQGLRSWEEALREYVGTLHLTSSKK